MRTFLKVTSVVVVAFLWAGPAQTQQDYNSGNSMLPLCKAWLRMMSHDFAVVKDEITTGDASPGGIPAYFLGVGMCAGQVLGIAELLNAAPIAACVPKEVTGEQVVRVVVTSLEQNPADLHEDFGTLATGAIIAAWPCRK